MSFEEFLKQSGYDISQLTDLELNMYRRLYDNARKDGTISQYLVGQYRDGQLGSARDITGMMSQYGIQSTPEVTQYLNNEMQVDETNAARDYNTQMRDTSITSSAEQLASLGLSPNNVLSTGGSGIGSSGMTADISKANPALDKAMADFNQKASMTRTIIGLIGGLGSAGIIGGSRLLARKAASAAASSMAHSGLQALKVSNPREGRSWNELMQELEY